MDDHYQKAVQYVAKRMLYYWKTMDQHDDMIEALKYAIGLGGGESIHPEIGPYWLFEYKTDFTIRLSRKDSIEVLVSKKTFLSECEKIWNLYKGKSRQLELFG